MLWTNRESRTYYYHYYYLVIKFYMYIYVHVTIGTTTHTREKEPIDKRHQDQGHDEEIIQFHHQPAES